MKNAVAYLRMSTDKQEYSIESQKRIIKEYAKKNNYTITNFYTDKGISGRDAFKRAGFMNMIEDSKNRIFSYVIIYDSSRFARNLEQSLIYKSILKKNGVTLVSVTEPTLDEDNQLITDAILGAMNEMYSRKLSKVVKRGMAEKAIKGEYISCAPYGYFKPKGEGLKILENEAKTVKNIYNDFIKGKTAYAIAKDLNEKEIKTKRGNFIDTRWVKKILTNVTYKGYYKFNIEGKVILTKSNHLPIIEEEIFQKAQEIFNKNIKRTSHKGKPLDLHKHWLVGLIRCKHCKSTFVYSKYYNNRQDRYRCGGYITGKCKFSFSISVVDLEELILNSISKFIKERKYSIKLNFKNNDEKKILQKEMEKYKKALENAKNAYLMEIDTIEEYKKNKITFLEKLCETENKLEFFNNIKPKIHKFNSPIDILYGKYPMIFKNKIAKELIEQIIIDGENRNIRLYFFL